MVGKYVITQSDLGSYLKAEHDVSQHYEYS